MRPQPSPAHDRNNNTPRTSLRFGDTMGTGEGARSQRTQSAVRPHRGLASVPPFFIFLFFSFYVCRALITRSPVRRRTCRTHDATGREEQRPRRTFRWSPLRALNSIIYTNSTAHPWRGTCLLSPNPLLTALLVSVCIHSRFSFINNAAPF